MPSFDTSNPRDIDAAMRQAADNSAREKAAKYRTLLAGVWQIKGMAVISGKPLAIDGELIYLQDSTCTGNAGRAEDGLRNAVSWSGSWSIEYDPPSRFGLPPHLAPQRNFLRIKVEKSTIPGLADKEDRHEILQLDEATLTTRTLVGTETYTSKYTRLKR